jgi:hypothetical protein
MTAPSVTSSTAGLMPTDGLLPHLSRSGPLTCCDLELVLSHVAQTASSDLSSADDRAEFRPGDRLP